MTAGEDQPQALVGEHAFLSRSFGVRALLLEHPDQLLATFAETRLTSNAVDRFVTRRADDPGSRILRYALAPPLLHGGRERLLRRILGEVEVADKMNERRNNPPEFFAVKLFQYGGSHGGDTILTHRIAAKPF